MIGICSAYFNPLHNGHLKYLYESSLNLVRNCIESKDKSLLIAIINNDEQVKFKGGVPFLDEDIRYSIVQNLKMVDMAWMSVDKDESVAKTIQDIITYRAKTNELIYFFNSGDQKEPNPQEDKVCKKYGIEQVFLDLPKINSSSEILNKVGKEWHERYMRSMTPVQDKF